MAGGLSFNSDLQNITRMLFNFFKTAWRNLLKHKFYSAINLLGLSAGMISCLFIALYVQFESSYDEFFPSADRIYRVALERVYPERIRNFASSPVTLAPTLIDNYPEVEAATRMHRLFFNPEVSVQVEDETFIETRVYFADSNFFKVFEFEFLEGTPATALNDRRKVVLTDKTAARYFGDEPALDKTLRRGDSSYVVSAVIRDVPENAHLDFDLIGSIHDLPFIVNAINTGSWINPWVYTYLKLKEGVDPRTLQNKFPQMVEQYGAADISSRLGDNYASLGHALNFFMQPLEDIHLHSNLDIEVEPTSNVLYLKLLIGVAIFILVLSCINFVNLATARSMERAKEVGIRKVMGSTRRLVIRQFLFESIIVCLVSFLVALAAAGFLQDAFFRLVGQELSFDSIVNFWSVGLVLLAVVLVGIAAGAYPAAVISSVNSATVLKGSYRSSNRGIWLRNGLIVFQFALTLVMISATLFVDKQMRFLAEKDLGFQKEGVLVIRQAFLLQQNYEAFKNELQQYNEVLAMGGTNAVPGDFIGSGIFRSPDPEISDLRANTVTYDDDFIDALNLRIIEGRGFQRDFNDSLSVIINQAAAEEIGLTEPVGKKLRGANDGDNNPEFTIVGVVEDFNFTSLHTEISPLLIFNGNQGYVPAVVALRVDTDRLADLTGRIEATWNAFVPDQKMKLSYLDEDLLTLYEADQTTGKVFRVFTYLAIIIAFVGLFSLATYVIQLRTKEIGIRKILGASLPGLFMLLSKNFLRLALLSLLLSIPVSYYLTRQWLQRFAYHVEMDWLTFLKAGMIAVLLVFLAISYQTIRVALSNLNEVLRSE